MFFLEKNEDFLNFENLLKIVIWKQSDIRYKRKKLRFLLLGGEKALFWGVKPPWNLKFPKKKK